MNILGLYIQVVFGCLTLLVFQVPTSFNEILFFSNIAKNRVGGSVKQLIKKNDRKTVLYPVLCGFRHMTIIDCPWMGQQSIAGQLPAYTGTQFQIDGLR